MIIVDDMRTVGNNFTMPLQPSPSGCRRVHCLDPFLLLPLQRFSMNLHVSCRMNSTSKEVS